MRGKKVRLTLQRNFFKPVKGAPTRRSEGNIDPFSAESAANPTSYTYLNLVNMVHSSRMSYLTIQPFEPDFVPTFCALLAILAEAYQRFLDLLKSPYDCTQSVIVAFQKVDEKIKKNVLAWAIKEVDDYCRVELQKELDGIDQLITIPALS